MAGNKIGGMKARDTNYMRHGKDFYKKIGGMGGKIRTYWGGFYQNRELVRIAGAKGGRISRRGVGKKKLN